jgi:hypothetical protein
MITVIIPTLWKCETTQTLLFDLISVDQIDEIIIINNDSTNTPKWDILNNCKITVINKHQNIFVNPSWNLGVEISKNNSICLLNDDITFDKSIFNLINEDLLLSVGLIGLDIYNNEGEPRIEQIQDWPFAFGCMMFVHKHKYKHIPEQLKIMWGDTFLLINLKRFGLYVLRGSKVSNTISVTTGNSDVIAKYNLHQICAEESNWWNNNQDKIYENI